jgi:hypothetical protein
MTTTRVTTHSYDFRGRRIATDGEIDFYEKRFYDNLDRVTKVDRHDMSALQCSFLDNILGLVRATTASILAEA